MENMTGDEISKTWTGRDGSIDRNTAANNTVAVEVLVSS